MSAARLAHLQTAKASLCVPAVDQAHLQPTKALLDVWIAQVDAFNPILGKPIAWTALWAPIPALLLQNMIVPYVRKVVIKPSIARLNVYFVQQAHSSRSQVVVAVTPVSLANMQQAAGQLIV